MSIEHRKPDHVIVWHVTARDRAEKIRKEGLVPKSTVEADVAVASGVPFDRDAIYYFDDDTPALRFQSKLLELNPGTQYSILVFEIPESVFFESEKDETYRVPGAYRYRGSFPPGWIVDII